MFNTKKVEQLYKEVYGEENDNVPCSSSSANQPLKGSVRQLEWKVKRQAQIIDALVRYLNVNVDREYSEAGDDHAVVIVAKKKSK